MKQFLSQPFATTTGNETIMTNGQLILCLAIVAAFMIGTFIVLNRKKLA
jgi:hypothetical protein